MTPTEQTILIITALCAFAALCEIVLSEMEEGL